MLEIKSKPIESIDTFHKYGCRFVRRSYNKDTNVYVYERWATNIDTGQEYLLCLEVVRPKTVLLHDGTRVNVYPSTENFGVYGKCVDINGHTDRIVDYLVNNPDGWGPEEYHNMKCSLK